jgi:trypsin
MFTVADRSASPRQSRRGAPSLRRIPRSVLAAAGALVGLLLVLPQVSSAATERYQPGPQLAPGVFLAEAPHAGPAGRVDVPGPLHQPRIVGGDLTTIAEWPWQAAITANPELYAGNGFERQFCGGSLVAPTIVVTAAHCTFELFGSDGFDDVSNFASITGRTTLSSSEGQEIPWSEYFFFVDGSGNPLYDPSTSEWDVVFARLASPSPASNSSPIMLAGADEAGFWAPADENAWATGWGTTSSGGFSSDTLREVNFDVIADSFCQAPTSYGGDFLSETMLCAGETAGGQDTCQGDSGGPLVTPIGGGTFRLIGDTSWGFGCALPNLPGIYGRVAQDPMCSALRSGIQTQAGVDVVGPGGCLAGVPHPPPPNDVFPGATLTGLPSSTTGTNAYAAKEPGEPNHAGNSGGASVWYSWTAPSSGQVKVDTCESDFDTLLGVYTGSPVGSLIPVASSDDACGLRSSVTYTATVGTTYRIAVDGYDGATGAIDLDIARPPQCSDGADNDGDGLVDFPADPGCSSLTDDDESNLTPQPQPTQPGAQPSPPPQGVPGAAKKKCKKGFKLKKGKCVKKKRK